MTIKERESLFKINELIKKLSQAPMTTYIPQTGEYPQAEEYQSGTTPLPLFPPQQPKR